MASRNNIQPMIHLSKRPALVWWRSWLIRAAAVGAALVVSAIVTVVMTGLDPIEVFAAMLDGAFGTKRRLWALAQKTAVLLCVALALTPAFKMRFWNTGGEGQILVGGLATTVVMMFIGDKLPAPLLYLAMFAASITAGALWGVLPALFKAKWNTNETLFTLMMNYIAIQLVSYFVYQWAVPKGSGKIGIINQKTQTGWLPAIAGKAYLLNILIVVAVLVFVYIYLTYSKHGYEIAVVGESENTARYIGIDVPRVIVRTMVLSGALCGLAGLLLVAGTDHTITRDTAGGQGFTAIMVSWLAKFDPIYMVLTSLLICALEKGAGEISTQFSLNSSFADIITGIIIFFIIGSEFFINYQFKLYHAQED